MPLMSGWFYRKLGSRFFALWIAFEGFTAVTITLATVALFSLYEDMSTAMFWELVVVAEAAVVVALIYTGVRTMRLAEPVVGWVKGGRDPAGAPAAWRRAVSLPREVVVRNGPLPFAIVCIPIAVAYTIRLDLPWYSAGIIFAATLVSVAYAAVLQFFASELFLRPVIEDIVRHLPPDWAGQPAGVPLRWKLLGALPLINVITGVVVSGLSTTGSASLRDLGIDVIVAVVVAFTISMELTVLLTKSILGPVDDLLKATNRVKEGDLDARVPVTSGDEIGELAGSFNEMLDGLTEREQLRQAFGSYVDPDVADRVLEEGELLEGQEVEVTVLFVDVRDFTPFAERSSARETVTFLNDFFDVVVPILLAHGGHANKFVGDGVLGVFGAPDRLPDHADRALGAARQIVEAVNRRFGGEVSIGIGLNSGPVAVGSVGGGGRLEFAVIGDPVNVAARVEKVTRETGDAILLTEATRCLLTDPGVTLVERGEIELKGKSDPVPLYAVEVGVDGRTTGTAPRLIAET
jgi:class 3 adenylate cyclase